jgi:hypothetical protein
MGRTKPATWSAHFTTWAAFLAYVRGVIDGTRDRCDDRFEPSEWDRAVAELRDRGIVSPADAPEALTDEERRAVVEAAGDAAGLLDADAGYHRATADSPPLPDERPEQAAVLTRAAGYADAFGREAGVLRSAVAKLEGHPTAPAAGRSPSSPDAEAIWSAIVRFGVAWEELVIARATGRHKHIEEAKAKRNAARAEVRRLLGLPEE